MMFLVGFNCNNPKMDDIEYCKDLFYLFPLGYFCKYIT